jgi:hypothetical protein
MELSPYWEANSFFFFNSLYNPWWVLASLTTVLQALFHNNLRFTVWGCWPHAQPPTWRTKLLIRCPAFYETRRSITVFTRARHWFLSWARWILSIPSHRPISLRSILILASHLRLGLPTGLFLSGFHAITLYTLLSPALKNLEHNIRFRNISVIESSECGSDVKLSLFNSLQQSGYVLYFLL